MFKGSIPALITPFKNGEIDWAAFENLIEWQIEQGSHALVPCGTTGESPTLSHEEHNKIVEKCVEVTNKRVPVIAGTGSNSTAEAIRLTKHAMDAGADAVLSVAPYYNKPTQEGLYVHYKAIHDECAIPLIIYNIPGRSVINISDETLARLAELPHIVGVKDATNDLARPVHLRELAGEDFCQLSGEDATVGAFLAQGGHGCITVVGNIAPKQSADLHNAWFSKDLEAFSQLRDRLAPLSRDLFFESNPAPVKYAASILGLCSDEVRSPLLPASAEARVKVDAALEYACLTKAKAA